jgi:hypothetical protein
MNQTPRITPVEHATPLLDEVQAALGATPNMTRAMAPSAVLEGWLRFNGALRKGAVGAADGEGAQLPRLARGQARPRGDGRARDFASADPRPAAVLAFAKAVLNTRGGVQPRRLPAAA